MFSKWVENTVGKEKLLVTSNFSFSHGFFKRLALQTRKNQGLFGKELTGPLPKQYLDLKQQMQSTLKIIAVQGNGA